MLQIAIYLSCGATACYLWGRRIKGKADSYNSITRLADIKSLDDLLKEKATNLLVTVSGKVASATPFNCKHDNDSSSGDVVEAKFEMGYETKLDDDGGLINKCHSFLVQIKDTPWYLTVLVWVKVVRAELADGYVDTLKPQFDMSSISEIFQRFENPQEGSKVICRGALDTGTSLTIVGEATRDEAGNLTIQKPKEQQSFRIFSGEASFDKMVGNLKSNSDFYFFYSKVFGTIAVAIAVVKGVGFVRKVLRERSENAADSDNEETTHEGRESDNSS